MTGPALLIKLIGIKLNSLTSINHQLSYRSTKGTFSVLNIKKKKWIKAEKFHNDNIIEGG